MTAPTTCTYDAIVVGLGAVGSFALRALAQHAAAAATLSSSSSATSPVDGSAVGGSNSRHNHHKKTQHEYRFLGLERYGEIGHTHGSSHGQTRIYRRAYFEHPDYVPLIDYSVNTFRELEEAQQISLLEQCGCLIMEPGTVQQAAAPSSSSSSSVIAASQLAATRHGIPVEYLDTSALQRRFPQFHTAGMVGLYEPEGGFVRCERAMQAAIRDAVEIAKTAAASQENNVLDVSFRNHVEVLRYRPVSIKNDNSDTGDDVAVEVQIRDSETGQEGTVTTRCLLLSMGAWARQLIPSWAPYLQPTRQLQGWIDVGDNDADNNIYYSDQMPVWYYSTPALPVPTYGIPCDDGVDDSCVSRRNGRIKIGIHGRPVPIKDPASHDEHPPTANESEVEELQHAAATILTASSDFVATKPCLYTMTPDEHFIIGPVVCPTTAAAAATTPPSPPTPSSRSPVFAVAGLSGHGFKMAPALGQIMADYAFERQGRPQRDRRFNVDFCSPRRFGIL